MARRVLVTPPGTHAQLVVTPNADHVRLLRRPDFAAACATATLVCADGFPVALYAWLRGLGRIGRVTGCDILHCLMADPDLRRHRVFAVVESAATAHALHLWSRARGLTAQVMIAVAPPGLLDDVATQQNLAAAAAAFGATILLVTLGAPVSEVFVHRQRHTLPPCWALCVGQAVRVELGLAPRAPAMFRLLPLEWLWRMCQEPRRLAGRYLRAGLWFPCAVLLDIARRQPPAQAATPVA